MATPETESRSLRRPTLHVALLALAGCLLAGAAGSPVQGARISEPNTILYGRIAERAGGREFPITKGRLVWKLQTTGPGGREYQLTAQLEPLADGRFSYRLSIPHEALAYDLTVNSKAIGLASAGTRIRHVSVTVDGKLLTIAPSAVDGLTLQQSTRASALRIDLFLSSNTPDSDADALPDWWEDQHGLDKYDSADSFPNAGTPALLPDPAQAVAAAQAQTFAQWKAAWFPGNTTSLDLFGQDDPDLDGVSNFLEYAFDLNPTQFDTEMTSALPHAFRVAGRHGIAFQKRARATDLVYQMEVSDDLFQWKDGTDLDEEVAIPRGVLDAEMAHPSRSGLPAAPEEALEALLERERLVARARRLGLEQDPDVQRAYQALLVGKLKERELEPRLRSLAVSDEDLHTHQGGPPRSGSISQVRLAMLHLQVNPKTTVSKRKATEARLEQARLLALQLPPGTSGFGPLALEYSDDDVTRSRGGDLGWLDLDPSRYHYDPALLSAGFALKTIGEVSPVVQGRDGLYLVRLVDRRTAPSASIKAQDDVARYRALLAKRRQTENAFAEETRAQIPVSVNMDAFKHWTSNRLGAQLATRLSLTSPGHDPVKTAVLTEEDAKKGILIPMFTPR